MARRDYTLEILREDDETLVLDGLGLARACFVVEPGAAPDGFDSIAGRGNPDRIELEDVIAMNSTARSRSRHTLWDPVLNGDQGWLRAIPVELDVIEADDTEWSAADGDTLLADAIRACVRPGIGLAGATKMLHLKRPRVVPILDQLVAQMIGVSLPATPTPDQRVAVAARIIGAIRREGRRNLAPLQATRTALLADQIDRPLVRILDAILWFSHPAASVSGARRSITVRVPR